MCAGLGPGTPAAVLAAKSRSVHEMYATAVTVADDADDLALLDRNVDYVTSYRRARRLGAVDAPWPSRRGSSTLPSGALMAPAGLIGLDRASHPYPPRRDSRPRDAQRADPPPRAALARPGHHLATALGSRALTLEGDNLQRRLRTALTRDLDTPTADPGKAETWSRLVVDALNRSDDTAPVLVAVVGADAARVPRRRPPARRRR